MEDIREALAKKFGVDISNVKLIENELITPSLARNFAANKVITDFTPLLPIRAYFIKLFNKERLMVLQYPNGLDTNNAILLLTAFSIFHSYCQEYKLSVPYWFATNNGFWGMLFDAKKSLKDGQLDENVVDANYLTEDLKSIHDNCFEFLRKVYQLQNTIFTFRKDTNGLNKGYWFDGEIGKDMEQNCILSFWNGYDSVSNTPNIFFEIIRSGTVRLVLSSKDNKLKQSFFEDNLTLRLGGFEQKIENGKKVPIWYKIYITNWKKDYIESLNNFIQNEKEDIDEYLKIAIYNQKKNLGDLNLLDHNEFSNKFINVLEIKERLSKGFDASFDIDKLSSYDLKLKKMVINNIGNFRDFEIDLSKRIICLMGENGCGKTTILRSILLGLIGVDQTIDLDKQKFKDLLRIEGMTKEGKKIYAYEASIKISYELDKQYNNLIKFNKPESSGIVKISDEFQENTDSFALTFQNYLSHLILGFPQLQGNAKEEIENFKKPNINDVLPLLYGESGFSFGELKQWIINLDGNNKPNSAAKKIKGWEKVYAKEDDILKLVFKIVSEITKSDEQNLIEFDSVNHLEGIVWVRIVDKKNPQNSQTVPFDLISQGFQNVFSWVGHFIKRLVESSDYKKDFEDKYALVLIDEIDTYLHPKWQRYILNALAKNFKNVQFIVTTHSPFVMNYLEVVNKKDRVLYIIEKGKETARTEDNLYGRSLISVFLDWMGISEYPKDIVNETEKILALIDSSTKDNLKKAEKMIEKLELENEDALMVELKSWLNIKWENLLENQKSKK